MGLGFEDVNYLNFYNFTYSKEFHNFAIFEIVLQFYIMVICVYLYG